MKLLPILLLLSSASLCFGQAALMPMPRQQFFDSNGNPLAGGFVFTYLAGTTTPQTTYTDSTGLVAQTNPLVLDAGGFPPNGTQIWLGPTFYKICVQNSFRVQQWCADNVSSYNLPFTTTFSLLEGTAPGGSIGNCLLYGLASTHRLGFNCNAAGGDTVVGISSADTLFNKTLSSPNIITPLIDTPNFVGPFVVTAKSINNVKYASQFASVQAAVDALPAGGGTVYLDCGVAYGSIISWPSGLRVESLCPTQYTSTLQYSGGQSIGPATSIAIKGVTLAFPAAANLIITDVSSSTFDMKVTCVTGSPCVNPVANASNMAFNRFDFLDITTGGQKGIEFDSTGPPNVGPYFTVNDFGQLNVHMTRATLGAISSAISFVKNCDSNHFQSAHLFFTNVNIGNGIIFNSSVTPAVDVDADNIVFDLVDFTSGIAITGNGYTVNKSAGNKWVEGFGQTSFTNAVSIEGTTKVIRELLDGSGICFGFTCLSGSAGSPVSNMFMAPTPGLNIGAVGMSLNSPTIAYGSVYASVKNISGCTTGAVAGNQCASAITVTWPNGGFRDALYSAGCSTGGNPTNFPSAPFIVTKSAASMTVNYFAITGAAASWVSLDCWGVHD